MSAIPLQTSTHLTDTPPVFLASEPDSDGDDGLQPANAASTSTSNQGTLSASDSLNSNASAQLAPSAPATTTISTLPNPLAAAVAMPVAMPIAVAVPVAAIESVSDPEIAPYVPVLVREGGHYYTNIWSSHYRPRSFDV